MANDPWTSARLGTNNDAPAGGQFLAELVNELGKWTEPTFANVAARDTALANWVANGNVAVDGMRCRTANDKQSWVRVGGVWTWPKAAQGVLARADFATSSGLTPLANTATQLVAFNMVIPSLPGNRRLRGRFNGTIQSDTAGTAYGFIMAVGAEQFRGVIGCPVANVAQTVAIPHDWDVPSAASNITCMVTGGRFTGNGLFNMVSTPPDGPMQFVVEDLGAI